MSRHPRPLVVGMGWPDHQPGGLNRYVADLRRALRGAGVEPSVLVTGPADPPGDVTLAASAATPLLARCYAFARAARWLAPEATVLDAHFAPYGLAARLGAPELPLVVRFHGPWADESAASGESRAGVLAKWLIERSLYRQAAALCTESFAFRQVLVERYRVSPWRCEVVRPTVDLERFRPGDRGEARRSLGLPETGNHVVAVRRLVPRMGLDTLLEAWCRVSRRQAALLVIVGDGPERPGLEALAERLGVADSVRFAGRVGDEDLAMHYRAADLTVVPSRALEGFGLIVLESLASGTPALVTDIGGLPETVEPLDPELVVTHDAEAMAGRLQTLLAGGDALPEPRRCRAYAARYDDRHFAAANLALYRSAMDPPVHRRVVVVDHTAQLSGAELAMARTLPALEVRSHVVLGERGPLEVELRRRGVSAEVLALGAAVASTRRAQLVPGRLPVGAIAGTGIGTLRLAARLRSLAPDLVHTNSLKAAVYGSIAARLAGVPVVWHVRDRIDPDSLPASAVALVRRLARTLPAGVIANSEATLGTLPALDVPTAVVPSPIDEPLPGMAPPEGPLVVGMVGRLAPWKGQDLFLEAFARAFPDGPESAVLVGDALFGDEDRDFARSLHERARRPDLAGRVRFTGHLRDVRPVLGTFQVAVHASRVPEPFGQVVVEAMAAGVAVVAADAGGPRDLITPGVDGLLTPLGDVEALAGALRSLAHDPARRRALGERARQRAEDFFPSKVAPRLDAFYEEVLAASGSRRGGHPPPRRS